jgi:hypothetical protein
MWRTISRFGIALAITAATVSAQDQSTASDSQEEHHGLKAWIRSQLEDDETSHDHTGLHFGPWYPRVEIVSSGAGPGPMLHFWKPDIGGSPIGFHASGQYSIYNYQYYDAQFGAIPHEGERLPRIETGTSRVFPLTDLEKASGNPGFFLFLNVRHRDYTREAYFGLGPDSLQSDRTDYRRKDTLYEGEAQAGIGRALTFQARAGLLQNSLDAGEDSRYPDTGTVFLEPGAPGLTHAPDFFFYSGGMWLELRDERRNPHRGIALGTTLTRYDESNGSTFNFTRAAGEAMEYVPIPSDRSVVALRQIISWDSPDKGSGVPFFMMSSLGGSDVLRGFNAFRFQDLKVMAFQAEYRFEITPRWELAALFDAGKVFSDSGDFDLSGLETSWGGGIRWKSPTRVRVRLDVAHSREHTRVFVKLGPSF